MYEATRDFIKARQKFTKCIPTIRTDVQHIGGGEAHRSFQNAQTQSENSIVTGNKVISILGWVVKPYNKSTNSTAVRKHWWNFDVKTGEHFDTSPTIIEASEYVLDYDLYDFRRTHAHKINNNVTKSLLHRDGKFSILEDFATMKFLSIDELRTELLFAYK